MPEDIGQNVPDELKTWIRSQLDAAVHELIDRNIVDGALLEAKPAWVFPFQVLIGKFRAQGDPGHFKWFICGEVATDHLDSAAAASAREAARHFALKWQLDPAGPQAGDAETLYALVDDSSLWQEKSGF